MRFRCPLKQAVPSHEILWLLSDSVRKEQCNSRPLTSLVCTAQRHALCVYTFVNKVWRSLSPVPLTKSFRHWAQSTSRNISLRWGCTRTSLRLSENGEFHEPWKPSGIASLSFFRRNLSTRPQSAEALSLSSVVQTSSSSMVTTTLSATQSSPEKWTDRKSV